MFWTYNRNIQDQDGRWMGLCVSFPATVPFMDAGVANKLMREALASLAALSGEKREDYRRINR